MKEFRLDAETVKLIRSGQDVPDLSERERALVHGVENAEIVEALSMALLSAFTNTLALTLNFEEDLERFGMRNDYF